MAVESDFRYLLGSESPLSAAISARDADMHATVRAAVNRGDVILAYQPVMTLGPTMQPAFYEALARVRDVDGRILPAKDFIHSVEATETGRIIDCLALQQALATLRGVPWLGLSVNMSARSIGYQPWMRRLHDALEDDPTLGDRLILEITESSAMVMPDLVSVFMRDLQRRGIAFALDDFGAGYTAFRYLRQFYFDILKIDGQFIQNIHMDTDNQVLVRALVAIGQHFDMYTVAESVEGAEELAFLRDAGIDCVQGYFTGSPTLNPPWIETGAPDKT